MITTSKSKLFESLTSHLHDPAKVLETVSEILPVGKATEKEYGDCLADVELYMSMYETVTYVQILRVGLRGKIIVDPFWFSYHPRWGGDDPLKWWTHLTAPTYRVEAVTRDPNEKSSDFWKRVYKERHKIASSENR